MAQGLTMVLHAAVIGIILYLILVNIFKQVSEKSEDISILVAAVVLMYMILFGHGLPCTLNKNIFG